MAARDTTQLEPARLEDGATIVRLEAKVKALEAQVARLEAELAGRPSTATVLHGVQLQRALIREGSRLCPACEGKGEVFDAEDEEMMGCPRCDASGRLAAG